MDKQSSSTNKTQTSQAQQWSGAELRRVSRVFELLVQIDKRLKKGTSNEIQHKPKDRGSHGTQVQP